MRYISELVWGMDAVLGAIGSCCRDLQWPLSLFKDLNSFWFCDTISSATETRSVGEYKVVNCQISLTIHHGVELSIPLVSGGQVNPNPKLVPSYWVLEHSRARQTKTSLRVTKCHREAIFDGEYLGDCTRCGCDSRCYRTVLQRPTITSLSFWRS